MESFNKKNLSQLINDHNSLLSKKRELYFEFQKENREKLFTQNREVNFSIENNTNEDFDIFSYKLPENKNNSLEIELESNLKIEEEKINKKRPLSLTQRKKLNKFSRLFSIPDYMISIPNELNFENWLIYLKPEGETCLIISKKGKTVFRNKNGFVILKINTNLPGGNISNKKGNCLLEGIYIKENNTCFISDILCWNDYDMKENSAETRFFWIETHVFELPIDKISEKNNIIFKKIHKFPCNAQNLYNLYYKNQDYLVKNGIIFLIKNGLYLNGPNPFILIWEDSNCSTYYKEKLNFNNFVLVFSESNQLITYDGIEIMTLKEEEIKKFGFFKGNLVKILIEKNDNNNIDPFKIEEESKNGKIPFKIEDYIKILGKSSILKGLPDNMSKILFFINSRKNPLIFQEIYQYLSNF